MKITISEAGLQRLCERDGGADLRIKGRRLFFTRHEVLPFRHRLTLLGERNFGGTVTFDSDAHADAEFDGPPALLGVNTLSLVAWLAHLCRCGASLGSCECCAICGGRGFLAAAPGRRSPPCDACDGRGHGVAVRRHSR